MMLEKIRLVPSIKALILRFESHHILQLYSIVSAVPQNAPKLPKM